MNFHSWSFAFFFIVVYVTYLFLRRHWQNRMLLAASYFFYGFWDWRFLFLIMISTMTDYVCGRCIQAYPSRKKIFLSISLMVNLGILGFFKYFLFLCENLAAVLSWIGIQLPIPDWNIILPVGISFYTFQTLSYTIDVYRGQIKPVRNFFDFALFVSFFPQLLAGPIERAGHLIPQIQSARTVSQQDLSEGFFLIYWGLFKKVFIADNLGIFLYLYGNPFQLGQSAGDGGLILITGYAFFFQLYCDFSAYSDIARGLAMVMGFNLMENFKAPLFASNIQETWARWHISLTSWVRDYVYYPLALARFGKRQINDKVLIIIVFFLIGLWHGASWNFVFWGLFHGVALALYAVIKPKLLPLRKLTGYRRVLYQAFAVVFTFHINVLGAILFRAGSFQQVWLWIDHLATDLVFDVHFMSLLGYVLLLSSPLLIFELYWYVFKEKWNMKPPWIVQFLFLYFTFYLLVIYGAKAPATFIYFQF